ncbi:MAG: D-alanyl-D-alanine carboxypeptidase/D-alanyl-D-alanine-endopeptidase [Ignavibacteria bacterium]|nr:D-alanyl-D-alanine carboxypeptidase/D-alanyl-D-alanine-endopeptidase [Ignavibacteria bacterium]
MLLKLILVLFQFYTQNYDFLYEKISEMLKKNLPKGSKYSLTCFSTQKKDFVIKINSTEPLIPASTNKLITTGIALLNLGKDFSINTELYTDDLNLNDGIINGNLYLKGYGDPTLETGDFVNLVSKIKSQNIQAITGNLYLDDTFFDEIFYRNEWIEDENISVPLPPISAITVNNNSISLTVSASNKLNKPGSIYINDNLEYFQIINHTKTIRGKTRLSASSKIEDGKEIIIVSGTIRKNSKTNLRVHVIEPAYYAGHLLKKLLLENGISFWGKVEKNKIPKLSNRIGYISTPLVEFLKPINKNSNNYYAEHLFLIIGGHFAKGQGSPFDASRAIVTTLKSLGIYEEEFNMVDGSGISRQNQFTTELLVKFLYQIYLNPDIFYEFYNSLSIPQRDGTLIKRFHELFPPERLRGKTGTLNGVTSLAGYITANSGDLLIFAINFNYSKGSQVKLRTIQDKVITLLAEKM